MGVMSCSRQEGTSVIEETGIDDVAVGMRSCAAGLYAGAYVAVLVNEVQEYKHSGFVGAFGPS